MDGPPIDIGIRDGRIAYIGSTLGGSAPDEVFAGGAAVLPGLHDHHIHLFAAAASSSSVDLGGATAPSEVHRRIERIAKAGSGWLRAIRYDERLAGLPDRLTLDLWCADRPMRLQDRTGALWVLNSSALELLRRPYPSGVEIDRHGQPTGRLWRCDAWLREQIGGDLPSLGPLSRSLAAYGVTGVTDAGANNGSGEARALSASYKSGELLQNLTLMGSLDLEPLTGVAIGPLKILLDDRSLPDPTELAAQIRAAHDAGRAVAAHCVAAGELAVFLAALDEAGLHHGDRIEHGGIIFEDAISSIAQRGLTVVSQPQFIEERGDRYRAQIPSSELPDLYRLNSLAKAGVRLAAGSDAPYGSIDPWKAIRAAQTRLTADGYTVGIAEALSARSALALYLGSAQCPGGPARTIEVGVAADLCLLNSSLSDMLSEPDAAKVEGIIIGGKYVASRNS